MIRNKENSAATDPEVSPQDSARLWELQADICQLLGNPKRLQILNLLKKGELSVGAMVQALGVPKANLSQHLALLRQKGILATRRQGTAIFYRLAIPYITDACGIMREVLLEVLTSRGSLSRNIRAIELAAEAEAPEE